jgi:glycosyltransferase involved in cell wall biosynthesis
MAEPHWAFIHPFQLRLQRGIEVYLWNLASALAQQGIPVDILTWDGPLDIPNYARVPGVTLHKIPTVRYFQAQFSVFYYIYWLLKGKYQHVFVHFAGYGEGLALRLARLLRPVPFSVVFHFPPSQVPHRYREFKRWNFHRDAAHLIAVSQAAANEVEQWAGRSCKGIGHGVDPLRFQPDPTLRMQGRRELELGEDAPLLISVAALEERKGIQWVIRAMPELMMKMPGLHYVVIGDGPYRDALRDLAVSLGVDGKVHFPGAKLDVRPYLCAADLMMVLAKGEAHSIALLEALACGIPVITSMQPPFDELVNDAWGMRVDEKDTQQVAAAVLNLMEDAGRRTAMGAAGRAWVSGQHAWDQVARKYQDLVGVNP